MFATINIGEKSKINNPMHAIVNEITSVNFRPKLSTSIPKMIKPTKFPM